MYDLIIVGAGPAGMTAAIYAARRKVKFLILSMDVGGQMNWSSEVENYPGSAGALTGIELVGQFQKHMADYKIRVKTAEILKVSKRGDVCFVKTKEGYYKSKAVLIATGKKPRKLGVPGEDKLLGKGLSYCATCDAPLYKGKDVAVVGGGNSGMEAVLFLSKYARKVYLLEVNAKLAGEKYLRDKVLGDSKISVIVNAKVTEIEGSNTVEGIRYLDGSTRKSLEGSALPETKVLKVGGVFVEVGLITEVGFVDVEKNKWGEIKLFRGTKTHNENLTSVPGIFAAGDCTDVVAKQIVVAAGEGAKAAMAGLDYVLKG